jgi:hypothetical protein
MHTANKVSALAGGCKRFRLSAPGQINLVSTDFRSSERKADSLNAPLNQRPRGESVCARPVVSRRINLLSALPGD